MLKYKDLKIYKYPQSGFRIEWPGDKSFDLEEEINSPKYEQVIYIDPFRIPEGAPKADLIFLTHEHFDHLDPESIKKILQKHTVVFGNELVKKGLRGVNVNDFRLIDDSTQMGVNGLVMSTVPAFNVDKLRPSGVPFHPKENEGVGYILEFNIDDENKAVRVYHMGDTDFDPGLHMPVDIDILMIPISGKFVMSVGEALDAIEQISPQIGIPMHHDAGVVGAPAQADEFAEATDIKAEIMEPLKK